MQKAIVKIQNLNGKNSLKSIRILLCGVNAFLAIAFPLHASAEGTEDVPPIPIWMQNSADSPTVPAKLQAQATSKAQTSNNGGRGSVVLNDINTGASIPSVSQSSVSTVGSLPDIPNAFQRFVTDTTGQSLPIFGQNLFQGVNGRAFGAIDNIPAPSNYIIGPGDEIHLQVWGGVDADLVLVVDRNGQINIPKIGTITVTGSPASGLNGLLKREIGRVFSLFEVAASLGKLKSIQIYVVGQARRPGAYTVSSLSTLVNALFASGGPGPNGTMRHIELRRGGSLITSLDLYGFITKGAADGDVHLLPGDIIVIPPAGPRVALLGALDTPGVYELKSPQEPLGQVLGYAGGTTALTSMDKVSIERVDDPTLTAPSRSVMSRSLDASGLSSVIKDGDVITLQKINPDFTNAITLRGNVAAPLRYPFKKGMHLSDLLPEPAALLTPDYFKRKNVLVQMDSIDTKGDQSTRPELRQIHSLADEPNWNYAVIERMNSKLLTTELIPFNLGAVVHKTDPSQNLALQPGDIVTIFGNRDMRLPQADHTRLVRVDGEVRAAGVYELQPGDTVQSVLRRAGGVTAEAYLYGTEFTREQTKVQQQANLAEAINRVDQQSGAKLAALTANLSSPGSSDGLATQLARQQQQQIARLRDLHPNGRVSLELSTQTHTIADLPDLPLENGDAIYVPPMPAFVTVVGAVNNENALIWKPNRTVADVLNVAGVQRDIADIRAAFILRADGSVFSESSASWLRSFKSTKLMPGDTVIVPEQVDPRSPMTKFMAGLKDWTQVFANFGLGAAAITVLK
ncbi:SLBB domain-containing protein [Robbsia sp. KACC 23696]|uniref:polysaccharide biosynthesis/export family protein n=1 Tax=Robbsia sp. KACC 23696 TaxID=3149231 RepID=UPI00325A5A54